MNVSMILNKNLSAVRIPHSTNSWDPGPAERDKQVHLNIRHVETETYDIDRHAEANTDIRQGACRAQ